jgi:hypothetical protein
VLEQERGIVPEGFQNPKEVATGEWYTLLDTRLVSARTSALTNRFSPSAIASLTMRLAMAVCSASSWLSIYPGRRSAVVVGPRYCWRMRRRFSATSAGTMRTPQSPLR